MHVTFSEKNDEASLIRIYPAHLVLILIVFTIILVRRYFCLKVQQDCVVYFLIRKYTIILKLNFKFILFYFTLKNIVIVGFIGVNALILS